MSTFPEIDGLEGPLEMHDSHVWATSETHAGLTCHIVLRKLEYRIRLDLHKWADGEFHRGSEGEVMGVYNALIMERTWDYPGGKPRPQTSFAARDKAGDALTEWLAKLVTENADGQRMLNTAGRQKRESEIAGKQSMIAKLREELADAEAELTALSA